MLEDGTDTTPLDLLTVPLPILRSFAGFLLVVPVPFFLFGDFVGLVSLLFFSSVDCLDEAIVYAFTRVPSL